MDGWFFHEESQSYYREKEYRETELIEYSHFEIFTGSDYHECIAFSSKKELFYLESRFGNLEIRRVASIFLPSMDKFKATFEGKPLQPETIADMFQFLDSESTKCV